MGGLIVYFSRKHQNYVNGVIRDLKVGNTETATQMIQALTKADLFQIEPIHEYSKVRYHLSRIPKLLEYDANGSIYFS